MPKSSKMSAGANQDRLNTVRWARYLNQTSWLVSEETLWSPQDWKVTWTLQRPKRALFSHLKVE